MITLVSGRSPPRALPIASRYARGSFATMIRMCSTLKSTVIWNTTHLKGQARTIIRRIRGAKGLFAHDSVQPVRGHIIKQLEQVRVAHLHQKSVVRIV